MTKLEALLERIAVALERSAEVEEQHLEVRKAESQMFQRASEAQTTLHERMLPGFPAPKPDLGVVESIGRCPRCQSERKQDMAHCCNEDCRGIWGTGCYHCHHERFLEGPT